MTAEHPHGTPARYDHGSGDEPPCREACCRKAKNAARVRRHRQNAYGRPTMTPAGPVHAHVEALRAAGMGVVQIAARAGVSKHVVRVCGTQAQVTVAVATKLLAVTPNGPAGPGEQHCYVSSLATQRRLQGLIAMGWPMFLIATEAGMPRTLVERIAHGRKPRIQVRTATRVQEATTRLFDRQPPKRTPAERRNISFSRGLAWRNEWVPLAAWNDLDDPDERPDLGSGSDEEADLNVIGAYRAGRARWSRLNDPDRYLLVAHLQAQGIGYGRAAKKLQGPEYQLRRYWERVTRAAKEAA